MVCLCPFLRPLQHPFRLPLPILSLLGHWGYSIDSKARERLTPTCRAITSLAVTIPSVYYLMQPQIERYQHPERHGHGGHGGHEGHDEHDEHDEHGEDGKSGEEGGSSEEESGDKKSEDQDEGGEEDKGEEKDTPNTSDDDGPENIAHETESGGNVEGVQFKGATSGGTRDGEQGDTRKHIPDAKGFNKKRIESDYGRRQGEAQKPEQDASNKDLVPVAPDVAPLSKAVLLTLDRVLHPNLRET